MKKKIREIINDLFQVIAVGGMIYILLLFMRGMGLI